MLHLESYSSCDLRDDLTLLTNRWTACPIINFFFLVVCVSNLMMLIGTFENIDGKSDARKIHMLIC